MTARPDTGTGRDTRAHVAAGRHTTTATKTTRGDLMRDTYTAAEVHTLLHEYYLRGRYDADINELHATWTEHDEPKATREQRVAARIADMEGSAARINAELGRPPGYEYRGGPVVWATGTPLVELRVAA